MGLLLSISHSESRFIGIIIDVVHQVQQVLPRIKRFQYYNKKNPVTVDLHTETAVLILLLVITFSQQSHAVCAYS